MLSQFLRAWAAIASARTSAIGCPTQFAKSSFDICTILWTCLSMASSLKTKGPTRSPPRAAPTKSFNSLSVLAGKA
eukprot:5574927-Lingulodinium_polyedra.AAC.1